MKFNQINSEIILNADSKALATMSVDTINVVPVSTVNIIDDKIILVNYFMEKTLDNVLQNPQASLVCWTELTGIQIKSKVDYQTTGTIFETMKKIVSKTSPERIVQGVLVLNPIEIFDISIT